MSYCSVWRFLLSYFFVVEIEKWMRRRGWIYRDDQLRIKVRFAYRHVASFYKPTDNCIQLKQP